MKTYFSNPSEGVCEAFFEVNPNAEVKDLAEWLSNNERSEDDPRVSIFGLANLCEQALENLTTAHGQWVDALHVARIAGALAHYETAIRAYNALIGHRRFSRLAQLPPIEALRVCLPHHVELSELM